MKGKGYLMGLIDVLFVDSRFMERWIIALGEVEDDLFDFCGGVFHL